MLFTTHQYLIFFVVVFAAYWAMPWKRPRVYLLLAASFYFYATWNEWLALLVTGTATLDFYLARGIEAARTPWTRRLFTLTSIGVNLGVLCYFKYVNFFLDSLYQVLGADPKDRYLLDVIIPFGISFYTF